MRTSIELDERLLKEAFRYSGCHTKKELINEALKEFVESHRRRDLREIRGRIQFLEDYDYKKLRRGR